VASGSQGSKLSRRYFLSRTSRSMRSATNQRIYLNNMAPPQTGPKKCSRRSRKARTEGKTQSSSLKHPKHQLTFSSLFVLRIVFRLRQRRLNLKLGAQANLQDCINQSQEKCQPFASRRNTTSSPGPESRQRAGFRIVLPPSGCQGVLR